MARSDSLCTAFEGQQCIASGELKDVALMAKMAYDKAAARLEAGAVQTSALLVFENATGEVIEFDWRGTPYEFAARLEHLDLQDPAQGPVEPPSADDPLTPPRPGRPRLGVVAREVTLLPRHWAWLATQSGGASVALRKLVEQASRALEAPDRARKASAIAYKCMFTLAGDEPGFEEASRALFAGDAAAFQACVAGWPKDVQAYLNKLLDHGDVSTTG